jgi:hypothetical protein
MLANHRPSRSDSRDMGDVLKVVGQLAAIKRLTANDEPEAGDDETDDEPD